MGATETLLKLAGLAETVRGERKRQEIADLKLITARRGKIQKEQLDSLKYITGRYTDLYFSAKGNRALQENILSTMRGVKDSLPPAFRQQLEMFTKAGPFSEVAEKKRKWYEIKGAPPRELTDEERKDISLVARHQFSVLDYNNEMNHFLTGIAPSVKQRVVGLGDGNVAVRGESGFIHVTTEESLTGKAIAKEYDQNFGTLLANDFKIAGESRPFVSVGREFQAKKYFDVLQGKSVTEIIPGKVLGERKHWESTFLTEVLSYVATKTEDKETAGGKLANKIIDVIDDVEGEDISVLEGAINQAVVGIPEFNNVYLSIADRDYDLQDSYFNVGDWFGQYGLSDTAAIIPIYGEMVEFPTLDGKLVVGFWDREMDIVRDLNNTVLGNYTDTLSGMAQRTKANIIGGK